MEPIPESRRALDELARFADGDLLATLRASSDQVMELVPDCVGLTIAYLENDLAFTLVATDRKLALLDAVQYLSGGPCVDSVRKRHELEFHSDDELDEDRWQHFAQAAAARSIRSTLTLPILAQGTVVGSVNLYAASSNAFEGWHEDIAGIFDAWAPGAVTNADLSFRTRTEAEAAPQRLSDDQDTHVALGILMARHGIDAQEAVVRLQDAARRAGVSEDVLVVDIINSAGGSAEGA